MKFKDYIPFYKRNFKVALPVMITQAGTVIVQFADNIMVGQLGPTQLAGVSFANAIFIIGMMFSMGFCQGNTPIVGQFFGQGKSKDVAETLSNAFILNLIMSVVLIGAMMGVGSLLQYMGQDPEVLSYALEYYFIMVISLLPTIIFFSVRQFSEGIGNTKYAMWITLGVNVVNIFLNWVLIFGELGFPAMGIAGAAYATLISRVLAAIVFVILLFVVKEYSRYAKLIKYPFLNKESFKNLFKLSMPVSLQGLIEVTAFSFTAVMVGWMGKYELAAHQIVVSLSQLTFMVALGIGAAATIRVSHQYGAGNYNEMKMAGKASIHMSVMYMCGIASLFLILRNFLPALYTSDPTVIALASKLIVVLCLFQVFDAVQIACIFSLRGVKDIKKPLFYSSIAYYLICIPCGYLLGFTLGLGPQGIWLGLLIGLALASILFYIRFERVTNAIIAEHK